MRTHITNSNIFGDDVCGSLQGTGYAPDAVAQHRREGARHLDLELMLVINIWNPKSFLPIAASEHIVPMNSLLKFLGRVLDAGDILLSLTCFESTVPNSRTFLVHQERSFSRC